MERFKPDFKPTVLIAILLATTTMRVKSEDNDDLPIPLTINHVAISGETLQGSGMTGQDEIVGYRPASPSTYHPFVVPFNGFWRSVQQHQHVPMNVDSIDAPNTRRRKKDCGFPVLARRLYGSVMKRSNIHFADSEEEVQDKMKEEDKDIAESHARLTRSAESHSGGCLAKRQWIDMGSDYYPRYVKSYHCSSSTCDKGNGNLGECKGKPYTTKVLKRITTADSTSVEDCDQTLPEDLRVAWKLISVTVTTCCDCVSPFGMFGLK